jgi:hypothetical protein
MSMFSLINQYSVQIGWKSAHVAEKISWSCRLNYIQAQEHRYHHCDRGGGPIFTINWESGLSYLIHPFIIPAFGPNIDLDLILIGAKESQDGDWYWFFW